VNLSSTGKPGLYLKGAPDGEERLAIPAVQPPMRPVRLCALLLLAGCTPLQWVKEDGTAQQLEADHAQCRQEAWREAQWRAWAYRPLAPILVRDPTGRPFYAWHRGPFGDPFSDQLMEEARLAQFCMRARGYRLEPVEKAEKK
jgi:hypothetical protein